jgi:hypothetical protein
MSSPPPSETGRRWGPEGVPPGDWQGLGEQLSAHVSAHVGTLLSGTGIDAQLGAQVSGLTLKRHLRRA